MTKGLPKVFLAIGMKTMEEFLKKQLSKEFDFIGEAIYREAVISNALQSSPDMIIIRETLNGSKSITDIVYEIRLQLPDTRIVFLASDRKPGDSLLAELVGNGVYDILAGNRLSAPDLMNLMREPNKFSDVAMYRPKMSINQETRETLFEAPPVKEVVKQVKQTVFVEGETPILPPGFGQAPKEEPKEAEKPKRNRRRFLRGKSEEVEETQAVEEVQPEILQEVPVFEPPKLEVAPEPEPEEEPLRKRRTPKLHTFNSASPRATKRRDPEPPQLEIPQEESPLIKFEIPEAPPIEEELPPKIEFKEVERPKFSIPEPTVPKVVMQKEPPMPRNIEPPAVNLPPVQTGRNETFMPMNSKQKILTFVGGDHGVGNSQVAYNTAVTLGKRGFKTIFIELKEEGSTIEYLYQLALSGKGLDHALKSLEGENFAGIDEAVIRMDDVRNQNTNAILETTYKSFPNSVDYLFFSPDYILESDQEKRRIDPALLKELCMHLFFQSGYHYIVLDAEPKLFNSFSEVALGFGTHVFYTVTQDVCHIGRAVRNISEINKRINITNKLYYIVNKFDGQADLSKKDIENWLKADVESVIPLLHKDFINANMNGLPILLSSKDKGLKKSFEEIADHILQK